MYVLNLQAIWSHFKTKHIRIHFMSVQYILKCVIHFITVYSLNFMSLSLIFHPDLNML